MRIEKEIIDVGLSITKSGLVKGTWGNISKCYEKTMWITPSGIPYEELTEDAIAVIDLENELQIGGRLKASSEMPLHLMIYKAFPQFKAIVHTHSIYASAFAVIGQEVPCYTEDQAQIIGGNIPLAQYALPGTNQLALNTVEALKGGVYAALLEKHGMVAVGRSLREAMTVAEIAEKSAQLATIVRGMNSNTEPISLKEIDEMRKIYLESYSKTIRE
ncbi:class II aldolase/adducin family protein [Alkaliphilus peptidifermentans]|uniref:L-fuculose-phosphate aldolase n=1 Tax=Alkaliphilus peptidifermentans DSM 18978 TaxID=1120976 RepID=A0A1G5IT64_9FIRM|nr:class II aldolase/adducin family protein [Alkaliphilus peptidifermentans]SCY78598.1 L-fuculose-phosphate aldolase [Alkaliphilus peptidifermentans DSM 18978]